ncbi:MAG TPA: hypothetical protein VGO79_09810 [Thermoanaerobaculia bacterium]
MRLALCAAALIAIGTSFGLHPEPGEAFPAPSVAFARAAALESNHGCVACLNHGVVVASPLIGLLPSGAAWKPAPPPVDPLSHGRLAAADLPGRSPPFDRS